MKLATQSIIIVAKLATSGNSVYNNFNTLTAPYCYFSNVTNPSYKFLLITGGFGGAFTCQ